jgi:hypothetical protein
LVVKAAILSLVGLSLLNLMTTTESAAPVEDLRPRDRREGREEQGQGGGGKGDDDGASGFIGGFIEGLLLLGY